MRCFVLFQLGVCGAKIKIDFLQTLSNLLTHYLMQQFLDNLI